MLLLLHCLLGRYNNSLDRTTDQEDVAAKTSPYHRAAGSGECRQETAASSSSPKLGSEKTVHEDKTIPHALADVLSFSLSIDKSSMVPEESVDIASSGQNAEETPSIGADGSNPKHQTASNLTSAFVRGNNGSNVDETSSSNGTTLASQSL
jgi:hypothetical protein